MSQQSRLKSKPLLSCLTTLEFQTTNKTRKSLKINQIMNRFMNKTLKVWILLNLENTELKMWGEKESKSLIPRWQSKSFDGKTSILNCPIAQKPRCTQMILSSNNRKPKQPNLTTLSTATFPMPCSVIAASYMKEVRKAVGGCHDDFASLEFFIRTYFEAPDPGTELDFSKKMELSLVVTNF